MELSAEGPGRSGRFAESLFTWTWRPPAGVHLGQPRRFLTWNLVGDSDRRVLMTVLLISVQELGSPRGRLLHRRAVGWKGTVASFDYSFALAAWGPGRSQPDMGDLAGPRQSLLSATHI